MVRDRWLTVLVTVGVLALLAGGLLGFRAIGGDPAPTAARPLTTSTVRSAQGSFSVGTPPGMAVRRSEGTIRLTTADRSAVITVGPGGAGPLATAATRLVGEVRGSYRDVQVLGRRGDRVDGRPALTTYGRASTPAGVRLRFLVVVVRARPANYAITTFAAADSAPQRVLPLVNRVTGSFHVLPASRGR